MKGNPWVYGFRNKLGDAVMYRRGGVQIARAYQPVVANPKTERQVLARARFSYLSDLAKTFRFPVAIGFRAQKNTLISARNIFMRINKEAVSGTEPNKLTFGYEEAIISKGGLMNVTFGPADFETPMKVTVPITAANTNGVDALASDIVYVAAVCPDAGTSVISDGTARRSDGAVELTIPSLMQGQKVHVYGFTAGTAANPTFEYANSDSVYIGFGVIS